MMQNSSIIVWMYDSDKSSDDGSIMDKSVTCKLRVINDRIVVEYDVVGRERCQNIMSNHISLTQIPNSHFLMFVRIKKGQTIPKNWVPRRNNSIT